MPLTDAIRVRPFYPQSGGMNHGQFLVVRGEERVEEYFHLDIMEWRIDSFFFPTKVEAEKARKIAIDLVKQTQDPAPPP